MTEIIAFEVGNPTSIIKKYLGENNCNENIFFGHPVWTLMFTIIMIIKEYNLFSFTNYILRAGSRH